MHKEGRCSNVISLHLFPDCKDLDARLYIEVADGVRGKQIDLMSENLVVKKPLKKPWDEEATLKSLNFFLDSISAIAFSTEDSYSALIDIL